VDRTEEMVTLRRDQEMVLEKASRARSVAASALQVAKEGLDQAKETAASAKKLVEAQEAAIAREIATVEEDRSERMNKNDTVEGTLRRGIAVKKRDALREARESMMIIRKEVEDITGEEQPDPITQETALRREDMEIELVNKMATAEEQLALAREAETKAERMYEARRKETRKKEESRRLAIWERTMRERGEVTTEIQASRQRMDEELKVLKELIVKEHEQFNVNITTARSAVVKRVKSVTTKFDKLMDEQLDACSLAKAKLDADKLKLSSAKRARMSAMNKLTRDLRIKEDEWEKERKAERRRLAQLQEDMERAQQDVESRKAMEGVDVEEKRDALQLQLNEVENELRKAQEDAKKEREALHGRCKIERADLVDTYQRRKQHLLALKRQAQEKIKASSDHAQALEPIEMLATDADELTADLAALQEAMGSERKQLTLYEEQMEADIRKKLVEADGMCSIVNRDTQERIQREHAKFAEDKAVLNAEADHVLAGIGQRRNTIRTQMAALQKTLAAMEEDIQSKTARAAEVAAELRPALERHEESKMDQSVCDEIDEQIHMGRHVGESIVRRIAHEGQCVKALHCRVGLIPLDHRLEARAAEFEAAKIRAELEWLVQEDRSLLMKSESVRLKTDRMIATKKATLGTICDIIEQESQEEQRRIKSMAQTYKTDFRSLPNERKNMLAAIAYKLSQLRVDAQKADRNISLISASISYRLTRSNRDEITELRHVALQQAQVAVEENKAVMDLEQAIRTRHDDLDKREQNVLGNIRRRKAALEGQMRALPANQAEQDRFAKFLAQSCESRTRAYEAFKLQVGKNELEREGIRARMEADANSDSQSAGLSVEDAEDIVKQSEALWEAQEEKLSALDDSYRQELVESTKEPELDELRSKLRARIIEIAAEMQRAREESEAREVGLRDKLIAIKRRAQEDEKDVRQWFVDQEQELRDLDDAVSMARAQVDVATKAMDRAIHELEDLRRRSSQAIVVELKTLVLENSAVPRDSLRKQFKVEDHLRKELEAIAEEEAEVEAQIARARGETRERVNLSLAKLREMKARSHELKTNWIESWELVVEKHRVLATKGLLEASASAVLGHETTLLEQYKSMLIEQGERGDAIEEKGEEQLKEIDGRLMQRLKVIDDKLVGLVKEKEDELATTVQESLQELSQLEATVTKLLEESRVELAAQEKVALAAQDDQEKEAQAAISASRERAIKANEERVESRQKAREGAAQDRVTAREFSSHEHRRMTLKYEKDMLYMGKTLERIFAEIISAVAKEEVRLEEARQAEVRRLEIQAKLEMEQEMERQQAEVARKYEEEQRKADQEAEAMRKKVMDDLSKMEEEARQKIEEEVRKMQMLQVLMQQEAMVKMETAMREKMNQIAQTSLESQARIQAALKKERDVVNTDIESRRMAKLEKLTGAWEAALLGEGGEPQDSAAAGAPSSAPRPEAPGQAGAEAPTVSESRQREIKAYEDEKSKMEAELAAIEAEIAALAAGADDAGEPAPKEALPAAAPAREASQPSPFGADEAPPMEPDDSAAAA